MGRVRLLKWGPRIIDVDILTYRDLEIAEPDLTVPHPLIAERAFVLVPWLEIDPAAELVGHGRVADLVATLDTSGVRRRDDLVVEL